MQYMLIKYTHMDHTSFCFSLNFARIRIIERLKNVFSTLAPQIRRISVRISLNTVYHIYSRNKREYIQNIFHFDATSRCR